MFPKIKRGWIVGAATVILLALLNPTYLNFKEFTGISGAQAKNLHKKANFLICSIYSNDLDQKRYLGFAMNFVDITPRPDIARKDNTDDFSTTTVTTDTNTTTRGFMADTTAINITNMNIRRNTTDTITTFQDAIDALERANKDPLGLEDDTAIKLPPGFKLDKDPLHILEGDKTDTPSRLLRKLRNQYKEKQSN